MSDTVAMVGTVLSREFPVLTAAIGSIMISV